MLMRSRFIWKKRDEYIVCFMSFQYLHLNELFAKLQMKSDFIEFKSMKCLNQRCFTWSICHQSSIHHIVYGSSLEAANLREISYSQFTPHTYLVSFFIEKKVFSSNIPLFNSWHYFESSIFWTKFISYTHNTKSHAEKKI